MNCSRKKELLKILQKYLRALAIKKTVEFLDSLKEIGFRYAMKGGLSVNLDDIVVPRK